MTNAEVNDPQDGVVRVGIVQDLTERRDRETSLRENVALTRAVIDAALDAIVIIDDSGVICDFNPTAEETFGYSKEEALGKTLSETIIPERYREAHEKGLKRYLREGTPHVVGSRIEIEAVKKDGREIPIELAIKPINVGNRLLFTSNIRDISDRRAVEEEHARHEAELGRAKEAAEAANKAKSEFLAAMSHEIRTPLNGVLGVLTLLGDTELSDEQRQLLNTAYGSGQNLFTLISDVLDLSKIEAGKMEQEFVDFNPLTVAEEATALIEAIVKRKGLAISVKSLTELPTVRSDQAQIRQILVNLVSNAAKFTDKGSISVSVSLHDGRLRYEVTDTGIGIAKEHQSRLFQRFSQVDHSSRRRFGGTGLGLAICRELANMLGGDIDFESGEGRGSTFWFEVPISKAHQCVVEKSVDALSAVNAEISGRILLAEDSHTNALVASSYLKSAGARVDIATNGLEVVTATSNHQYDLIVMDVSMPEMDGIEASEILRARNGWTRDVPIIALTANASREDKDRCIDAGMNVFLTKPIERTTLVHAVCDLLKNRVINAFREELQERLNGAEKAVTDKDFKTLARMGHALKSAAANVGKNLETIAGASDLKAAEKAVRELRTYQGFLNHAGYDADIAECAAAANEKLATLTPDLVLVDLQLPDGDGMDILQSLQERPDAISVVVITANASMNTAIEAMRAGALDFLAKPFDKARLLVTVESALERSSLRKVVSKTVTPSAPVRHMRFIGESRVMRAIYQTIEAVSSSDASVFITGESGTGKEVAARAIHDSSRRADKKFHAVNCGAIPENLMESELFGHVKGAFTGATSDRIGAAAIANGGTLFLDELAEMPVALQTKLLRFIQLGTYQRVGETKESTADIRFVCATNKAPHDAIEKGELREDLFYRLNVIPVEMPPLRERGEDVALIADSFLQTFSKEEGKHFERLSDDTRQALMAYDWPGNVRQLQNVIRNAVVLQDGEELTAQMLPRNLMQASNSGLTAQPVQLRAPSEDILPLAVVERQAIEAALAKTGGNIQQAARLLEIDPSTIHRRKKAWRQAAAN
ncbi:Regulatory protein LuxO [Durusdinium trenchii]|uniref:Regulatory protein LuxO n=1 Tax=Durusdinium trenchii TaxID=1381693 RepID=A0ABP0LJY5_9DINO